MPAKKKSSKAKSAVDPARKLKKTQAVLKKHKTVLKKIRQLLNATMRLVDSISTPPPSTQF
jgi:hypothetical protein